ncbi:hypothetical protein CLU79DRAFT_841381, partial [Phycomyces nitens]
PVDLSTEREKAVKDCTSQKPAPVAAASRDKGKAPEGQFKAPFPVKGKPSKGPEDQFKVPFPVKAKAPKPVAASSSKEVKDAEEELRQLVSSSLSMAVQSTFSVKGKPSKGPEDQFKVPFPVKAKAPKPVAASSSKEVKDAEEEPETARVVQPIHVRLNTSRFARKCEVAEFDEPGKVLVPKDDSKKLLKYALRPKVGQ